MKTLFTFDVQKVQRNLTVRDIIDSKGKRILTETTATSAEAAAAAAEAGIDMIIGPAALLPEMRQGAPHLFTTIGVNMTKFPGADDVLREAYRLLEAGADAIYCPREPRIIEHLAKASVPVMGHLGLVPRKSTWIGGVRAYGRTADEALEFYRQVKDLEQAGAIMAEIEVVASEVLAAVAPLTSMSMISLGSGAGGDVQYLFQEDAIGETENLPRHARAFGDIKPHVAAIAAERRAALSALRAAAQSGAFPGPSESISMRDDELQAFQTALDRGKGASG